jgi:ferredoxin
MVSFISVQVAGSPTGSSKKTYLVDCVHYYKDAMLGRFYAICNCCSCCCGAMQAQRNGTPMIASSGYVAVVDGELCAGCGECADMCQFAAISVDDGLARVDGSACMGCGVCISHCPQEAISLLRDPAKGEPLEIRELMVRAAK